MRVRLIASLGIGVLAVLGVAPSIDRTSATVKACWDVSPYPMFLSTEMPEDPRFYSGTLGILRPTYRRSALVAAWRTLVGRPLVDAERRVYVPDPSVAARVSARDVWLNARKTVSGLGFSNSIWQETFLAPTYSYILNCGDSALETAARTLDARRESLGANNPEFVAWVHAQDLVFSNCARQSNQSLAIPWPCVCAAKIQPISGSSPNSGCRPRHAVNSPTLPTSLRSDLRSTPQVPKPLNCQPPADASSRRQQSSALIGSGPKWRCTSGWLTIEW